MQSFLAKNKEDIKTLLARRGKSIGFNAFALVSDIYYRENFHSDIIAAILNPSSSHGEGKLFLRLFINYLIEVAARKGKVSIEEELRQLSLDDEIVVRREEGRIDIKIQAPVWTIIIENKINGANDQDRQLPKYVDKCGRDRVKAIVYLTAANEKTPDMTGWLHGDDAKVMPKLLPIVGYSESKSIINLADGWLSPCELAAKGFITKSILSQYKELVIHQAGVPMNNELMKKLLDEMAKDGIDYFELKQALEQMPNAIASMITGRCAGMDGLEKMPEIAYNTIAAFDLKTIRIPNSGRVAKFAIDVHCEDLGRLGISFFDRSGSNVPIERYLQTLQSIDSGFKYDKAVFENRLVLQISPKEAYSAVDRFIGMVEIIVKAIVKKSDTLARIASECVEEH